jgi:hypothetical protein
MSEIDEFQIWTSAAIEYVYRFYHLKSGETAELVVPHERLTQKEKKKFLKSRSWLDKDIPLREPDVRLVIESNGKKKVVTDENLVYLFVSLGARRFLMKHNESEFRRLLEIHRRLDVQIHVDSRNVMKDAIAVEIRRLAEAEKAFVKWFVGHRFPIPVREVPAS